MMGEKLKYSLEELSSYDQERHLELNEVINLLSSQGYANLNPKRLEQAINSKEIKVYEFKGQKYLDRIDIGRVYHNSNKQKKGLIVNRYFTDGKTNPFDSVEQEKRHAKIVDSEGNVISDMPDTIFPVWMDENSSSIVAQKYFYKPDEPEWKSKLKEKLGKEYEFSLIHLNSRVTNFFVSEGDKRGYFRTSEDRERFRDELNFLQINGIGAFNSPVQFNAGLYNEYGIKGQRGINYHRDSETGEVTKITEGEHIHPQTHACFIKGPKDNLESIAKQCEDEIGIFSAGSGIGQNIGALRAEGEKLSGGGVASGPISFWKIYDDLGGTIKSGGKSRRAARMTTMKQSHPDIQKFIKSKPNEDKKALVLMENGYSPGMDGEAYKTVAFQNTNISVRLDGTFFEQVKKGGEIELINVHDKKVVKKVSAERLLKEISFGSWRIGDPAVQYEDEIQEMHTCKNSGKINSSNPCSEYMFLDDTSCNLASLRLTAFLKDNGGFDVDKFRHTTRIFAIAQDIANDAASYPVYDIALQSPEFRSIGTGYADLGSFLIRSGIPYDSEEGRAKAAAITSLLTGVVYETSIELAENLEPFVHFEFNKKPMLEVIEKHKNYLNNIDWKKVGDSNLEQAAKNSWVSVLKRGQKHGFRNSQATALAPTGTISYLMGCSTTGVEPAPSLIITKDLAGGGNLELKNKDLEIILNKLGYKTEQVKNILSFVDKNNTVIGAPHLNSNFYPIFDTAFGNVEEQGSIGFEGHIKMLGAIQPFVSGAISKTNNLPESATVKEIYDGYILGYNLGLKAIAIFRNNSKPISPLNFGGKSYKIFKRGEKEDLPDRREAFETEVKIGPNLTPLHIIISEYKNGKPGQIVFLSYKSGSTLKALLETHGIQASAALKRGVSLEDEIKGWIGQEFEPYGLVKGHEYIKIASSPLDFAGKFLALEYLGNTNFAQEPEKVEIENLRGFKNGAFRTYEREKVDLWNIEQVLNDAECGGFVEGKKRFNGTSNPNQKKNEKGAMCWKCGHLMKQTGPNCYECGHCAEKIGGCGA